LDKQAGEHIMPVRDVPSAVEEFDALLAAIAGRRPAIFLDYDGTLTPIVARPELAILGPTQRAVIERLAQRLPVAVISGRDRQDVERLVGIDGLVFAGSHGFDIRVPGRGQLNHEVGGDFGPALDRAEAALRRLIEPIGGALVERKKLSLAAHYRQVAEPDLPTFFAAIDTVQAAQPDLKRMRGKKVFEFEPKLDWDKGKAVRWLLRALEFDTPEIVPLFFGDDVTDEDAFAALQADGIGIVVAAPGEDADRMTAAGFRVDDPEAALAVLQRLYEGS
jgi:trehalose-phosphatase